MPRAAFKIVLLLACVCRMNSGWAADAAAVELPPPASTPIDFQRDIQPILEQNCLRCHGRERPKSNFRLTERAAALKGGNNGVAIRPGDSANSPLIRYVARIDPEIQMPPEGKGAALSTDQVSLLRAWIDQGALWPDAGAAESALKYEVSPVVSWTTVQGDRAKFRELEWQPDGWNGGLEHFELQQQFPDGRTVAAEGRALRDDYKLTLELRRPDLGFTRMGFEQFRRYYADAGGYHPTFTPPQLRLDQDVHLDYGRAWVELGLTLPRWPRLVFGYEHQYRDGARPMLSWGPVTAPSGEFSDTHNIAPALKTLDEQTHIFRFDLSHTIGGFELEDNLRAEFYSLKSRRADALNVPPGATRPDWLAVVNEAHRYTRVANAVRVQKELTRWWLAGLGYRYAWLDGDTAFRLGARDGDGLPTAGSAWSAEKILLGEISHVANVSSQFRLHPQLTAAVAGQVEWKRQTTFGDVNLDEVIDPTDPTSGILRVPTVERSTMNQTTAEENVLLRYTGLPSTAFFAEARLKQEDWDRTAEQTDGPFAFASATDARSRWQDYRVGFNRALGGGLSLGGHFRHRDRDTDYAYPLAERFSAYPGFIRARNIAADEVEVRLVARPATWLHTTLTYAWANTDFHTTTDATSADLAGDDATPGGRVFAGRNESHTLSGNATATLFQRLSLTALASWQTGRVTTADNASRAVAPYDGELWSVVSRVGYSLDTATEVFASHTFSRARYGQNHFADGLPLGLDYDRHSVQAGLARRFSARVTARLQYGCFAYDEPTNAHLQDYTAHQVMAVVTVRR